MREEEAYGWDSTVIYINFREKDHFVSFGQITLHY